MRLHLILLVVVIALLPGSVFAQSGSDLVIVDGYVVDAVSGAQIAGARVRLTMDGADISWTTDAGGHFDGTVTISGENQLATVSVEAAGYGRWTMVDTALYAGQTRYFPAIMLRVDDQTIDAGGLPGDEPPPPPEYLQGTSRYQSSRTPQFWSHDIIPTFIRVARTGYLNCGYWENGSYNLYPVTSVEALDFRTYVKNVLPNEWPASWQPQSLQAGAMAVKMYAWYKINIGPRGVFNGQEYDMRSDTCDQVYTPNSSTSATDQAVDATWPYIMRRNGLVSRIHYTDRVSTCESAGLSPCMGQWDSQYMAQDGFDWQTILLTFYEGFQINYLSTVVPAAPANTNLIRNGSFDDGFAFWGRTLDTDYSFYDEGEGNFLAWKGRTGTLGRIAQFVNYQFVPGAPLEMTLELGNSSSATKTVRVSLHRFSTMAHWDNALECYFSIPPGTPMRKYALRYKTVTGWENARLWIEGYPADNLPDIYTDNVTLRYYPSLNITGKQCIPPGDGGLFASFWDFTHVDAPFAWSAGSDALANPSVTGGGLRVQTAGANPHLTGPTMQPISAANNAYVYVKLASDADSCGRVYFLMAGQRAFRETQAVDFTVNPDGVMRGYLVDMTANANWTGSITGLRVDPVCDNAASGRTITVERAMLWNSATPPQPPGDIARITPVDGETVTDAVAPTLFQWNRNVNALWYHVYVAGPGGFVINKWYSAVSVCNPAFCALPGSYVLNDGAYRWWIAGWGYGGMGAYGESNFTVDLAPPGLISRTAPGDPYAATFEWTPREEAVWYHVYVAGPDGVLTNKWHKGADVCTETVCAHPDTYVLRNGTYDWWMAAWNRAGTGQYDNTPFTINAPTPGAVTQISPQEGALLPSGLITLEWAETPDAGWYRIYIVIPDAPDYDRWVDGRQACSGGTCTQTVVLPARSFDWWMAAWGPGGVGPYNKVTFALE